MSIKKQFYKRISLFVVISTIIVSIIAIVTERNIVINDLKDKGDSIARILSAIAKDSMLVHDYVTMERYVREVVSDKNIKFLRVIRSDGEVIAESGETTEEGYNLRYPITIGEFTIGTIDISFSIERVDSISKRIILSAIIFILVVHAIAFLVNNLIINKLVISPVRSLMEAVGSIRNGGLQKPIEIYNPNEFGQLAKAFNDMSDKIQKSFRDIKEKQRELQIEKSKFEAIVKSLADGLFVTSSDGLIISFNPAASAITGYDEAEAIGRHCEEVFKTKLCEDACALHNEDKTIRNKESEIITRDGQRRIVSVSSALIRQIDGKVLGGVQTFRDITEEKQKQAMMCHAEKLAAIGYLSAGLAHEINNPIGNVVGYAKLLLKDTSLNEKQRERLEIISEQAEKAGIIVQGLLNYSRQQETRMERVFINDVIKNVVKLLSSQAEKNNIIITSDLGDIPYIKADPRQMEQVFFNILLNSIQAIDSDGVIEIRTSFSGDSFVTCKIKDTGPGIPEEYIHRIFDPFFTTKPVNKGTGLGLSVCMGIIKEHNGFIEVQSEPGKGTTFIVKLPATEGNNA
ncbi:MAG: ATP-binding protein [Thermodesulfovibrionales bacterium]